jgi:hypothetical protein
MYKVGKNKNREFIAIAKDLCMIVVNVIHGVKSMSQAWHTNPTNMELEFDKELLAFVIPFTIPLQS